MNMRELLMMTIAKGASDLHLTVGYPPFLRINGVLTSMDEPVKLTHEQIEGMVKSVLAPGQSLVERRDIDLRVEIKDVGRFRFNVYYDRNGICVAVRYVSGVIPPLEKLGLPEVVKNVVEMKRGLVLVTGYAGSGKSTTLASIIEMMNTKESLHVITIEDPIEFVHYPKLALINQRELGIHTDSFQQALRSALREDPNVIMVGELRDLETISLAVTAAETGHLVLATAHTRGAAQSVNRLIDVFPADQQQQVRIQVAECLNMVISQVLLPGEMNNERCLACEVMVNTTAIRALIRSERSFQIHNEIEMGHALGMQTLEKSLQSLIETGKISAKTARPWLSHPDAVKEKAPKKT